MSTMTWKDNCWHYLMVLVILSGINVGFCTFGHCPNLGFLSKVLFLLNSYLYYHCIFVNNVKLYMEGFNNELALVSVCSISSWKLKQSLLSWITTVWIRNFNSNSGISVYIPAQNQDSSVQAVLWNVISYILRLKMFSFIKFSSFFYNFLFWKCYSVQTNIERKHC